jgi:glycosyltransferase 2 family protein
VSTGSKVWRITWRLALCAALMVWICHTIFLNEARSAGSQSGQEWAGLTRLEQWQAAWSFGPRELWRTISLVQPVLLGASLGFMGLTILVGVWRWRRVLRVQGLDLPLSRALEISLVAHFFNSFLLGSTGGDVLKAYYAARETHHKKTEAVVTVFVDRLLGLFAMLLFAVLMMLPNLALLRHQPRMLAVAWCIVAMFLGCAVVVTLSFWGGVSRPWPQARAWLRRVPKGETLERCLDACRSFGREPRMLLEILGVSMLLNVVCVGQYVALARGLGISVALPTLFLTVPMVVCIAALPITPSGLGVRENLYVLLLSAPQIGVAPTEALSLSLLAYAGSLVWSLIGGLVYAGFRQRHHLAEVGGGVDSPGVD